MIIEKKCSKCGGKVIDTVLTCYPAIPQEQCLECGSTKTGPQDKINVQIVDMD